MSDFYVEMEPVLGRKLSLILLYFSTSQLYFVSINKNKLEFEKSPPTETTTLPLKSMKEHDKQYG